MKSGCGLSFFNLTFDSFNNSQELTKGSGHRVILKLFRNFCEVKQAQGNGKNTKPCSSTTNAGNQESEQLIADYAVNGQINLTGDFR